MRPRAMKTFLYRLKRCEDGMAAVEFAIVAPVLLLLVFGVIVYSLYFAAFLGVREAAAEGARAAMAGLSSAERIQLATARATAVIAAYQPLMGAGTQASVSAAVQPGGLLKVSVTYDIGSSPIFAFAGLLPLPGTTIQSAAVVANGSY
jgi:Flp pilus assembly protein TadG